MLNKVHALYEQITELLIEKNISVTAMESCTSGLIASLLTDTPGASAIFKGSFVTYSNEAKIACGVPAETIDTYGVYSLETAQAMAAASRIRNGALVGIGVTGSLGTVDPANADSVPGEVYIAIDVLGNIESFLQVQKDQPTRFDGKLTAAYAAGEGLLNLLRKTI